MSKQYHILFDGPPGPEAGRFVEVEDGSGRSIKAGEWSERPDGFWTLVISADTRDTFHNHLRQMLNIDFHQLIAAGVFEATDHDGWRDFQSNPWFWFIRTDDERASKVWALMEQPFLGSTAP